MGWVEDSGRAREGIQRRWTSERFTIFTWYICAEECSHTVYLLLIVCAIALVIAAVYLMVSHLFISSRSDSLMNLPLADCSGVH